MKEPTIVRSDEARRRFRELLTETEQGGIVEVRRYDTRTAIMVSPQWYDRAVALMKQHPAS